MNVSEKIRTLRKSKGMSQEELAGQVNISRQAVSRWENGTALPDADNIVQLSKLFGVTTDYLLMDSYESDEDSPKIKENNKILRANLTSLAIILQTTFFEYMHVTMGRSKYKRVCKGYKSIPVACVFNMDGK